MEARFETPGPVLLTIDVPGGDIALTGDERDTTTVDVDDPKRPDDYEIRCEPAEEGGHRVSIRYVGKRGLFGARASDIAVAGPLGARVSVTGGSSDVAARGELAAIELRGGSGDLRFDRITGDVSVKLASGDVEGDDVGGDFAFRAASGEAHVRHVAGHVVAKTSSGDLTIDAVDGSVSVTSVSGDVRLGSLLQGATRIRAVSGDVEVGVAAGTDVLLDLSSVSGETISELDLVDAPADDARLLELQVASTSGDIRVRSAPARGAV